MSEYAQVEKPFLDQLGALGWSVIDHGQGVFPTDPAVSLRQSFREWLLPEVFRSTVRDINCGAGGEAWLTDRQLDELYSQLTRQPSRTLLEANEAVQALLIKAQVDRNEQTGEADPVVKLIDFAHPERNRFHAINQFRIDTPGCVKSCIIPDVVLFVNGIPLVVVEAKVPDANAANPMHAAFEQLLRYRDGRPETRAAGLREGEPRLFHSNLLVIRTCGECCEFGTVSAGYEHFHAWRDICTEARKAYRPPLGVEREQERLIQGLLAPDTLLDVLRTCSVFMDTDAGVRIKVVARYQQYRAARKIVARLRAGTSPAQRSGVVWHTQGSGKSLTMVFVARMLRASSDLQDYKIVLVNDRVDLEAQLSRTARLIGGKVNVIENTADLRSQLSADTSDVSMVMVHKFLDRASALPQAVADVLGKYHLPPSAQSFGVVNPSERIVLMVDEAHRTQGSSAEKVGLSDNMFEAFPNATRIAFTGTPLITEEHGARRTVKRFGKYIDTYKLMDAVVDGTTLQILYEGRTADTAIYDKAGFDTRFEDLFKQRSDAEILAIKKKYGATGDLLEAEQRIAAIARDLVDHYVDNILPEGFKAQVVCTSKLAAVRYRIAINEALQERITRERARAQPDAALIGKLEFLKVAVVLSADSTNEPAAVTHAREESKLWNAVANFCKPFDFDDPDKPLTGIAFLVVCDMLLTGFDAPVEQVMYLDKKLREHNLLQAIARVNRVASGKHRGYIVDYIGLANHLAEALSIYSAEDASDIEAGLHDSLSELPVLEERYQRLLQHFRTLGVAAVNDFVAGKFATPTAELEAANAAVGALEPVQARADFEVYFKKFLTSLNLVLPHPAGQPYRGAARRFGYLLAVAKQRYKDTSLDIADAGAKVKALINAHLLSLGIDPKIPPVELLSDDFVEQVRQHAGGDSRARASEMEHAIRKHLTVHLERDPEFYARMSQKLERLIKQYGENWDLLAEQCEALRKEVITGRAEVIEGLGREATTFYGLVCQLAYGGAWPPEADAQSLKRLMQRVVGLLQDTIDVLDFWKKPIEIKRLRGAVDNELLLSGIPTLQDQHEHVAVEIVKLAERRNAELVG